MKITFLGGAGTVTGSKYLLEEQGYKLLVDCGLFQGIKNLRLKNWNPPVLLSPHTIDACVLTHAHIDHSGYIPVLCHGINREGFKGRIYSTEATYDVCSILLPDSAR